MGVLSNLVSGVLSNTSDINQDNQPMPNFAPATASTEQSVVNQKPAPVNYGDVKDVGGGGGAGPDDGSGGGEDSGGGGGIMGMAMSMLSDVNGKKNINPASAELDYLLSQVYERMKENK